MNWADSVDLISFEDAWKTWDKYYRKKYQSKLNLNRFLFACLSGEYQDMTVSTFIKMAPENADFDLINIQAATPNQTYPHKPRGNHDLKSVKYHMKTKKCLSPIILIKSGEKLILLDGMHRVVAAKFRKSKIRILIAENIKLQEI